MVIMEIVNLEDEISINFQDFINSIGTIIDVAVTIYFIFMSKFYLIFIKSSYVLNQKRQSRWTKTPESQRFYFETKR